MKVTNFKLETQSNWARGSATVIWEDCDRPTHEIFFETTGDVGQNLTDNPDAFLLATMAPALHFGEKRLLIDAETCPQLQQGIQVAWAWMQHWYGLKHIPTLESKTRSQPQIPQEYRAACMFSGGIDALATIRKNHSQFPPTHPGYIRDGILVYGFNFGRHEHRPQLEAFTAHEEQLRDLAQAINLNLITIRTNLRHLDSEHPIWRDHMQGAALSAVAHTLSSRFSVVYIAASDDIPTMEPYGTHPLLDPNYSSFNLKIHHDGIELSRLQKTRLISDWDAALQKLSVCDPEQRRNFLSEAQEFQLEFLNCGHCEKCIVTMTELLACNQLRKSQAFPVKDVSQQLLSTIKPFKSNLGHSALYEELITPLSNQGRTDLVKELKYLVAKFKLRAQLKQYKSFLKKHLKNIF